MIIQYVRRICRLCSYCGYTGVILASVTGILIMPASVCLTLKQNTDLAELILCIWTCGSVGWGIISMLVQAIDSLINRFF